MAEQPWENVQGAKEKPDELLRAIAMGNEWVKEKMALSELVSVTGMVTVMHPFCCPRREHLMFLLLVHL